MGIDDDRDGEGYHFYGSAIDEETGPTRSYRKKVKDVASTRQVPLHMQEVTDSDGRKRFHGAFTGGFSAGYYNTVGSKEGWAPQQFKSSRGDRAAVQQRVEDYLDEDELQESRKATIGTKSAYDTFGFSAADRARQAALQEQQARPGAALALPDDLVAPVADSVGLRLLKGMGWRAGKGLAKMRGERARRALENAARCLGGESRLGATMEGAERGGAGAALLLDRDLPSVVPRAKRDEHGLGFDPFRGAEEFRALKRQRDRDRAAPPGKRQRGVAFGTGVFDEDDTLGGEMDDYVVEGADDEYAFEEAGLPGARGRGGNELQKMGFGLGALRAPPKMNLLRDRDQAAYTFEIEEGGSDEDAAGPGPGSVRAQGRLTSGRDGPTPALTAHGEGALLGARPSFIAGFVHAQHVPPPIVLPPPITVPPEFAKDPRHRWAPLTPPPPPAQPQSQPMRPGSRWGTEAAAGPSRQAGQPPPPPSLGPGGMTESDERELLSRPPPPPPSRPDALQALESIVPFVARNGLPFERLALERNQTGPADRFGFLIKGQPGNDFYRWRLAQEKKTIRDQTMAAAPPPPPPAPSAPSKAPERLTAETRGSLLGELPRSLAPGAVANPLDPVLALFEDKAPAKAKDAPSADTDRKVLAANVAEADRVRIAEMLGNRFAKGSDHIMDASNAARSGLYTRAELAAAAPRAEDLVAAAPIPPPPAVDAPPTRVVEEWRPAPLVCKRFTVSDPYQGKAKPMEAPKSQLDYLSLPETEGRYAALNPAAAGAGAHGSSSAAALDTTSRAALGLWDRAGKAEGVEGAVGTTAEAAAPPEDPLTAVIMAELAIELGLVEPPPPRALAAPEPPSLEEMISGSGEERAANPYLARQQQQQHVRIAGAPTALAPPAAPAQSAEPSSPPPPPPPPPILAERPVDIFKAIFEDSDDDEEEEAEREAPPASTGPGATRAVLDSLREPPALATAPPPSETVPSFQELMGGKADLGPTPGGKRGEGSEESSSDDDSSSDEERQGVGAGGVASGGEALVQSIAEDARRRLESGSVLTEKEMELLRIVEALKRKKRSKKDKKEKKSKKSKKSKKERRDRDRKEARDRPRKAR